MLSNEENLLNINLSLHQLTFVHTNLIRSGSCILRITSMLTKFMQSRTLFFIARSLSPGPFTTEIRFSLNR